MMSQKLLHELLREEQEPFILKNYIADRRCLLKKPEPTNTQIQIKKRTPENSILAGKFCKNAFFFSSHDSPDVLKSPLFERLSPVTSSNAVFLHVPVNKPAILLDAAIRIHKQKSSPKTKTHFSNQRLRVFGSFLKRIANRNKAQNRDIGEEEDEVSVKDILAWDSPLRQRKSSVGSSRARSGMGFSNETSSGEFSSERNEEVSLDLETSCSSLVDAEFTSRLRNDFCESPFRFVLQNSPSSTCHTPEFSSPATSPNRNIEKEKMNYNVESLNNLQAEEEEDEEQLSPVSVLDPPFEDDEVEDDGCDLECSYTTSERTTQHLLSKLSRFEKLAELDSVELEKRMYDDIDEEESTYDGFNMAISLQLSKGMKRLISDIIAEEERVESVHENADEIIIQRVCKRLESWEEVKTNTIDMMVEEDLNKKKISQEETRETAMDVELAIFGFLVEEFATELES